MKEGKGGSDSKVPQAIVSEFSPEKQESLPLCNCTFGIVCAYAPKSIVRYLVVLKSVG